MRIGIDWGGIKLEITAINDDNGIMLRERVSTPQNDYHACLKAAAQLVEQAESRTGQKGTVGIGIPGTISSVTGLVKNANSTWLNGKPLKDDLQKILSREVRIENDANCFAVSEAVDGAGAGSSLVAGIIIGTGCGCGIAIHGKVHSGHQGIAGEFGHTQLSPTTKDEFPGHPCWCGRIGCLETYVSGPAFMREYTSQSSVTSGLGPAEILALNDEFSRRTYTLYIDRLARGLAMLINILDPDVIVLGGGMSNIDAIYDDLSRLLKPYVFTDFFSTPIFKARHGDSSGVRGAAWLW